MQHDPDSDPLSSLLAVLRATTVRNIKNCVRQFAKEATSQDIRFERGLVGSGGFNSTDSTIPSHWVYPLPACTTESEVGTDE